MSEKMIKQLPSEEELIKNWQGPADKPLVTIRCQTYNHANFINDTLKGFLIQKTDFPFWICILDDASTDGTQDIIHEYEDKYPTIIKPLYLKVNTWKKPERWEIIKPFVDSSRQGKYIAYCEGDDYWTDPYKLQKQVDFLEGNPEYGLVHTDFDQYDVETNKLTKCFIKYSKEVNPEKDDVSEAILAGGYYIKTLTTLFRRGLEELILEKYSDDFAQKFISFDVLLWFHLSRIGKIKYMNISTSMYRRHKNGVTSFYDLKNRYKFMKNIYSLKCYLANKYKFEYLLTKIHKKYLLILLELVTQLKDKELINFYLEELRKKKIFNKQQIFLRKIKAHLFFITVWKRRLTSSGKY